MSQQKFSTQQVCRLLAAAGLVLLLAFFRRHFELDDAFIYNRYIRNALTGNGLVFNPGERFNGMTSPLYAYLLLLTSWLLKGRVVLAAFAIFTGSLLGTCLLAEVLFPWSGILFAGLTYVYTLIGMESTLLLFLLTLNVFLFTRKQYAWLPLTLMLLALTRFEAGALILVMGWLFYKRGIRIRPWSFIAPLLLLTAYLFVNHHFYGGIIPQSSMAKLGQGRSGYWHKWPRAFLHIEPLFSISTSTAYALVFLGVAGTVGLWKSRASELNRILVPFGAILFSFYWLLNMPNYHWYYAPFILLFSFYSAWLAAQYRVVLGLLLFIALGQTVTLIHSSLAHPPGSTDYDAAGTWIRNNTPPDATVEACEIGEIGWSTHRAVIDVLGLTNLKNANHIAHRDVTSWLTEDQPDIIVMHEHPFTFEAVATTSPDYHRLPVSFHEIYLLARTAPKSHNTMR